MDDTDSVSRAIDKAKRVPWFEGYGFSKEVSVEILTYGKTELGILRMVTNQTPVRELNVVAYDFGVKETFSECSQIEVVKLPSFRRRQAR